MMAELATFEGALKPLIFPLPEPESFTHQAWEKGTNRFDYLSGKVDKYYWVEKGGSFVMSEILAAVLHAQLEAAAKIQEQRHAIWARYHARLESL